MARAYAAASLISVEIVLEATASARSERPLFRRQMVMSRWGERFVYNMEALTMLVAPHGTIVADHQARTLTLSARANPTPNVVHPGDAWTGLDSALAAADSVRYLGLTEDGKRYVVFSAAANPPRVDVFIDTGSFLLRRVIYTNEGNSQVAHPLDQVNPDRVDIRYSWQHPVVVDSMLFSESRFVTRQRTELRAAPAFAGYRVREVRP